MTPLIEHVSDTSFWVAYYRAKETDRKNSLFKDPLAQKLIGERGKKISQSMNKTSRYTEWAVISRTVIIDRFIEKLIQEGVDAIVNLGAGLDTRPYRMSLPPDFEWVEADYSNIIDYKNQKLKTDSLKCRLTRISVDLSIAEERKNFLKNVAPGAKKILVLTEGVIPYLSPDQVTELSQDLRNRGSFVYWIAEYFDPKIYRYLNGSFNRNQMRNAPFKFFPPDWFAFFKSIGWKEKEIRYSGEIAIEFGRKVPMPKWISLLLPFFPKKIKEDSLRTSGYVIFEREA